MLQAGVSQEKTPQCSQEGPGQALKNQWLKAGEAQEGWILSQDGLHFLLHLRVRDDDED